MIPTVIILGAGASKPYKFPLGRELRNMILNMNDLNLADILPDSINHEKFRNFLRALSRSGYGSVDAFLETRNDFIQEGKFAIAWQISRLEDEHNLFPPIAGGSACWYEILVNSLLRGNSNHKGGGDIFSNLKIITFNYDRSLEQYLTVVLRTRQDYSLPPPSALIIHVHGSLGHLNSRPYIPNATKELVQLSANSIKIVGEVDDNLHEFQIAKDALGKAERIWFFGFGYYEPNMRRLGFEPGKISYSAKVWTQTVGFNEQDRLNLGLVQK